MINYYFKSTEDNKLGKIDAPKDGVWISAHDVSALDIAELILLGFDEDLLEDANDYFEVPRFEYENGVNYFFTRCIVDVEDGELSTAPLLIAISERFVLTMSHKRFEFLDDFAHGRVSELITTEKLGSVILMIEVVSKKYQKSLMNIRRTMLRHFKNVEDIDEQDIKELVGLESRVADYISALVPTQSALVTMLQRRRTLELHEDDIDVVEDLVQDFIQLIESAKGISKTIQNIRGAHSSILVNKLNTTMKTLTAVTIVLTIPTIVASIFGMNTWLPFSGGPVSFGLIMLIIFAASYAVARWFSKSRWL